MPRKKKASADFNTAFDDDLSDIKTPQDSLSEEYSEEKNIQQEQKQPDLDSVEAITPSPNSHTTKFGLSITSETELPETVTKTYKISDFTARKLDSLVHKDIKNSKKVPGTKGFLSDFLENAIWQHFFQLGLISEKEANEHLKDYSKYPINIDNFKNLKK